MKKTKTHACGKKKKKIPDDCLLERINKTSSLRGCSSKNNKPVISSFPRLNRARSRQRGRAREGGNVTLVPPRVENNGFVSAFLRSGKFIHGWSNNWSQGLKGSSLVIKARRQQWESDTYPRILEIITSVRSFFFFLSLSYYRFSCLADIFSFF